MLDEVARRRMRNILMKATEPCQICVILHPWQGSAYVWLYEGRNTDRWRVRGQGPILTERKTEGTKASTTAFSASNNTGHASVAITSGAAAPHRRVLCPRLGPAVRSAPTWGMPHSCNLDQEKSVSLIPRVHIYIS